MEIQSKELAISKPKKIKKAEIIAPTNQGDETSNFIQIALSQGANIETMEKLLAMRKEFLAEKARGAYIAALANFQAKCPIIKKNKKVMNKDGRTVRYQYASLDAVIEQTKTILAENRLAYKFEVENIPGFIKTTAIITHELGHSEGSSFQVPIDTECYMTAPQKYASALTFAKRYAFTDALGITSGEEDTDATDVDKEPEPKSSKAKVIMLLKQLGEKPKVETAENYAVVIQKLTQLDLIDKNLPEIVARLSLLVDERQAQDIYEDK